MFHPVIDSIIFFVTGLCLGSFGNVCVYRIPLEESVNSPKRSYCPHCKKSIPWFLNIPLLSWLYLRGKCKSCHKKISWRYPIVELLIAVAFVLVFHRYGWSFSSLEYCIFAWGLIVASAIDYDHMILPDIFTLSGIVLGLVGAYLNPERELWDAFVGFGFGFGFLFLMSYGFYLLRGVEGMGGGDIKLIGWIGACLGWQSIPFTLFSSSLLGAVIGLIYLKKSGKGLEAGIPFGPFLSMGALLYCLFDVQSFMQMFFPL